eukprot:3981623-Ditylum_brightwellii.AAC.1
MAMSTTLASLLQGQTPEEIADLLATVLRTSSAKQEEEVTPTFLQKYLEILSNIIGAFVSLSQYSR